MSSLRTLSIEDRKKLDVFMAEGLKLLQQIEDIKGGLKDTTKALAEDFGIPPASLTTALRTVFKNALENKKEEMTLIEELLHLSGYN